jgi:hypothetical protein
MLRTILITNDTQLAREAEAAGVSRILIDLEQLGKHERQKSRTTFISTHRMADIAPMRVALSQAELMVRLNPWHEGSPDELEQALAEGAQRLMLPMITDLSQLEACLRQLGGRAPLTPLLETAYCHQHISTIAALPGFADAYIGLNDLHLALGQRFLFEPLAHGQLEAMARTLAQAGKAFGFGGIGALGGAAELSPQHILAEHARLGSGWVILSSRFAKDLSLEAPAGRAARLQQAIAALQEAYTQLLARTPSQAEAGRKETVRIIEAIATRLRQADAESLASGTSSC